MRFAAAALALSGAVMADYGYPVSSKSPVYPVSSKEPVYPVSSKDPVYTTSTVYATSTYTVKSANSNVVYSSVYPLSTTTCTAEESKPTYPVYPVYNSSVSYSAPASYPVYTKSSKPTYPVYPTGGSSPVYPVYPTAGMSASTQAPVCVPTYSVETISTSYTTVIPTVVYKTVSVPCPEATYPSKPSYPVGTGYPVANTTSTYVTAGAASLGFSGALAAAAGLAAVFLA